MTVTGTYAPDVYTGDDSQTSFPITFQFDVKTHVKALVREPDGTDTDLTQDVDFSISSTTLTYPISGSPLAAGDEIVIYLEMPLTQTTDFINTAKLDMTTLETAIDVQAHGLRQVDEMVKRAVRWPTGDSGETDAAQFVADIEAAQAAAEVAQGLAEAAQAGAEVAQASSEAAQVAAEAARDEAQEIVGGDWGALSGTHVEIKRRRGTTAQHAGFTGAEGEITVDTDKKTVMVHDGATAGGTEILNKTADQDIASHKEFQDGKECRFGNDNDMQIVHSGTNGFIKNNTGDLNLYLANGFYVQSPNGAETLFSALVNGASSLFYDNALSAATINGGFNVNGNLLQINGAQFVSFALSFYNDGGTIKHKIEAQNTAAASLFAAPISGASATLAATPSVGAAVDFTNGVGLSDAGASRAFLKAYVADAAEAQKCSLRAAAVYYDGAATDIPNVKVENNSKDINGATRLWIDLLFMTSDGAATGWVIDTTRLPAGKTLTVLVTGWMPNKW